MQFRTELHLRQSELPIDHATPLLMLGSCFTDEVGDRLRIDGFNVTANPLGPVYNPAVLTRILSRALDRRMFTVDELVEGPRGYHCLTFASRYSGPVAEEVITAVNSDFSLIAEVLSSPATVILTLGSAYVFTHEATAEIVGNCHKLPGTVFSRRLLGVDEIVPSLQSVVTRLKALGHRVIFTVSPIRHLADGLHGNTISKSTLHLAVNSITGAEYFPAYEALIDDLRDYRFYAADMKHPSDVAVDYIYGLFADVYFSPATSAAASEARSRYKRNNHRQILS
ncbi:MAG: GSCFA domain-containing protein [Duncaniella sp.]|nr:GSCFA domain-containing protein [Duncaniella sp.]